METGTRTIKNLSIVSLVAFGVSVGVLSNPAIANSANANSANDWVQFAKLTPRQQDVFAITSGTDRFPKQPPLYAWRIGIATSNCMRGHSRQEGFADVLSQCLKSAKRRHAKRTRSAAAFSTTTVAATDYAPQRAAYGDSRSGLGGPAAKWNKAKTKKSTAGESGGWRTNAFASND